MDSEKFIEKIYNDNKRLFRSKEEVLYFLDIYLKYIKSKTKDLEAFSMAEFGTFKVTVKGEKRIFAEKLIYSKDLMKRIKERDKKYTYKWRNELIDDLLD